MSDQDTTNDVHEKTPTPSTISTQHPAAFILTHLFCYKQYGALHPYEKYKKNPLNKS